MSVGYSVDKSAIDARAGYIATSVRNALEEAVRFHEWLNGQTYEDLESLGYTTEDVAALKAGFFELNGLRDVAWGQALPPGPSNFFFHAAAFWGVN